MNFLLTHQRSVVFLAVLFCLSFIILLHPNNTEYWLTFWWMFPIAFVLSLAVNIIGISSAALFVPFFILIFPFFSQELTYTQSIITGLFTESFGLASSALSFLAFGLTDKRMALYAVFGMMPFLILGTIVVSVIPESILLVMIAGLLVISVFFIFFEERLSKHRRAPALGRKIDMCLPGEERIVMYTQDNHEYHYCRTYHGHIKRFFGYGIGGFFQGAVGFGAGELGIISMMLSRIPIRVAIGTSHLIVAVTALLATIIHVFFARTGILTQSIPWNIIVFTVPAVAVAGQISPYVASRLPTKLIERFMAILFSGIAFALLFLAFK